MSLSSLKLFLVLVILGIICFYGSAQATWEAPLVAPPGDNRPRPLNVGSLAQEKTGSLILSNATNALIIKDQSPLIFGDPLGAHVGFKAPASITTSVTWTLPVSDGVNGYVLATGPNGQLYWANPLATMNLDADWAYEGTSPTYVSIGTKNFSRFLNSGTIDSNMRLTGGSTPLKFTGGAGDVFIENRLEVDGLTYLNNTQINGTTANTPGLKITAMASTEGLRIISASNYSPLNIQNSSGSDIFRVDQSGTLASGTVPWGRLNSFPSLCTSPQVLSGYTAAGAPNCVTPGLANGTQTGQTLFWNGNAWINNVNLFNDNTTVAFGLASGESPTSGFKVEYKGSAGPRATNTYDLGSSALRWKSIFATNMDITGSLNLGFANGSMVFHGPTGLAIDTNNLFWDDTSNHLGLGTSTPADFTLQVAGDVGPNTNNTYFLGSAAKRWANIFATNVNVTGSLNLGFATGSVIFQGASGLAQNNSKFFWDNTNSRLGLGTNTPSQTLAIDGSLAFLSSDYAGTSGALFIGGKRFMSSIGSSYASLHGDWTTEENTNTFLGSLSGAPLSSAGDQLFLTDNTGIGFSALTSSVLGGFNTAIGSYSLHANYDGTSNTAVGVDSLTNNVSGSNLTAVGFGSLGNTTTGTSTAAIGYEAGYFNSSGSMNFFAGNEAGFYNDSGEKNVNIGYQSGYNNIAGSENVFIGSEAGYNNKQIGNVMIGSNAGANNTTGSGNVFLGVKAGFDETGSNKLYIEASKANSDSALIFGQFYTASVNPFLRLNGKVGISPRGTSSFTPNKLLHLYQASGDNAEIDIQSVSGTDNHWGIYQDRGDSDLRFWQGGDKVIFSNGGQVAIGGAIVSTTSPNNLLLRVYGSTESNDYWSADNNQKGGTAYVCTISRAALNGGYVATRMRFEDGLYICSCSAAGQDYCDTCTCTNP